MPVCWLGVIREYEPIKPPIEEPDEPITTPSTDDIIKTKIGDIDMIVGSNIWKCITYGNGKYVVGNNQGQITTSTDGKTWATPKTIPNIKVFSDIVYDNSKFVAVSYFGASKGQGYITTSTDGVNWTTPKVVGDGFGTELRMVMENLLQLVQGATSLPPLMTLIGLLQLPIMCLGEVLFMLQACL